MELPDPNTHTQIYIPATTIFRIMAYIIWKCAVSKSLLQIPHKVLSDESKISRSVEYKMAKYAVFHMLLKFIINRVFWFSLEFYATLRTRLHAIWTTPDSWFMKKPEAKIWWHCPFNSLNFFAKGSGWHCLAGIRRWQQYTGLLQQNPQTNRPGGLHRYTYNWPSNL